MSPRTGVASRQASASRCKPCLPRPLRWWGRPAVSERPLADCFKCSVQLLQQPAYRRQAKKSDGCIDTRHTGAKTAPAAQGEHRSRQRCRKVARFSGVYG
jgi:hypothetical protein